MQRVQSLPSLLCMCLCKPLCLHLTRAPWVQSLEWSALAEDLFLCLVLEQPPESQIQLRPDIADYSATRMAETGKYVYLDSHKWHWEECMSCLHECDAAAVHDAIAELQRFGFVHEEQ